MKGLDILLLFGFVLSCVFVVNLLFKVIAGIFSDEPKQIIIIELKKYPITSLFLIL